MDSIAIQVKLTDERDTAWRRIAELEAAGSRAKTQIGVLETLEKTSHDNYQRTIKRAKAAEAREKQACVDRYELLAELDRLREAAESVEEEAIREIQVEKLSGNIVKEEHWKGQMVAARIILMAALREKGE